jgi:hypothetical protein
MQSRGMDTPTDSPLDRGIARFVDVLRKAGVETFESCEGGPGHAYPEPTVRFHGEVAEGFRALSVAMQSGLPVAKLRRIWSVFDGEPSGPWWELVFVAANPASAPPKESRGLRAWLAAATRRIASSARKVSPSPG